MSDFVDKTPEARWRHLRENGPKLLVNLESNQLIEDKPEWFDEEKFSRAHKAIQEYLVGVLYSSFTGLLLILQLPDGLEPLLATGNSKDIPSLFKRYLNTIEHVNSWYEDDVFNPETKGYKSIRQVRAMHKRLQSIMNDKFKIADVDGRERLWFNQYDVAMTQFAFVGLAMLFPPKSGLIGAQREDLELINYYWRVLGHLMGIKDEFNASQFDNYDDILAFNKLIFENEYIANFKRLPCQKGLEMTQSICVALHDFTPLLTFNQLANWWSDCFQFNGYQLKPLSAHERILDGLARLSFNHLLKYERFRSISNKLHKKRFERRLKNKDKIYERLCKQYKDNQQLTYFSDRFDYFNKSNKTTNPNGELPDANNNNEQLAPLAKTEGGGCPFGFGSMPVKVNETASLTSA